VVRSHRTNGEVLPEHLAGMRVLLRAAQDPLDLLLTGLLGGIRDLHLDVHDHLIIVAVRVLVLLPDAVLFTEEEEVKNQVNYKNPVLYLLEIFHLV